jgi:hypothetical protein
MEGEISNAGPSGARHDSIFSFGYEAQVLQLPELQLEHELPLVPGTALGTPPRVALSAEKVDILRLAGLWHLGHSAGWLH